MVASASATVILPSEVAAARFLGGIAGLVLSYVIPRLLVRHLLEKPRTSTDPSTLHTPGLSGPDCEISITTAS